MGSMTGEGDEPAARPSDHRVIVIALALALVPFVVGAVALVTKVNDGYYPNSDWAVTEMHVRDVGRHEVLIGLWSHYFWSHPGPMLFYLLTPFYWLTGRASVGLNLGALAINAAAVIGMALVARRRGGTPLLLCTLLGCGLMIRTLGAGYLGDPWVSFITALPFALLLFLVWSMACGDVWALPVGAVVATFLAQTHVGFVLLAAPLLALGAMWLLIGVRRDGPPEVRRGFRRAALGSAGLLALLWLPPLLDAIFYSPSNAGLLYDYFLNNEDEAHSLGDGWRVVMSQFGLPPEWLTEKTPITGVDTMFLNEPRLPILLLVVALAAAVIWRRRPQDGRPLVVTLVAAFGLSIVAIARTTGPVFDYRLRWTWAAPMVAFVLVVWVGWTTLSQRWRNADRRLLVPVALVGLAALGAVNVAVGWRGVTPRADDDEVLSALAPSLVEALDGTDGEVLVADVLPQFPADLYVPGLALQLERHGIEAAVHPEKPWLFNGRRAPDGRPEVRVAIAHDRLVELFRDDPDMELVAEWTSLPTDQYERLMEQVFQLEVEHAELRVGDEEFLEQLGVLTRKLQGDGEEQKPYAAAVFIDRRPEDAGDAAGSDVVPENPPPVEGT